MGIAENSLSVLPDGMIYKYIEDLYYAVNTDRYQHQARSIGKYCANGRHCPVAGIWLIEEPGLTDTDENDTDNNSDFYGFVCIFSAFRFA